MTPDVQDQAQTIESSGQAAGSTAVDETSPELPAALPANHNAIRVTALTDLWIEIAADGVLLYQGNLQAGESTGWVAGEKFNVNTSSGRNTQFTNQLGQVFTMGNEEGQVTYYL
jgi:hypothetical protein